MKLVQSFKLLIVVGLIALIAACGSLVGGNGRHLQPLKSQTVASLRTMGSSESEPMVVRIFKETSELEVWKRVADGTYKKFRTYEICTWSGELGPKIREGDRQAPEGFYTITPGLMNPNSNYYLSFNLGFPNKFDRAYGRTGAHLMVHGDCSSAGCYAMTDEQIAEIYALARESFSGGQRSFQVQIFPFHMTPENLARYADNPNIEFWQNLKVGYDHFEVTRKPPEWDVCNKQYVFNATAQGGGPLNASAACPPLSRDPNIEALVAARQSEDNQRFAQLVADAEKREFEQLERDQQAAEAQRAAEERGQAMNEAVTGFFSTIFGGAPASDASTATAGQGSATAEGTIASGGAAPVPAPAPN